MLLGIQNFRDHLLSCCVVFVCKFVWLVCHTTCLAFTTDVIPNNQIQNQTSSRDEVNVVPPALATQMIDQRINIPRCMLHIHINAIFTIIAHDLLSSGLVAKSVEQWLIKCGGRWFDSRRSHRFFQCLVQSPISMLGLRSVGKFMGSQQNSTTLCG